MESDDHDVRDFFGKNIISKVCTLDLTTIYLIPSNSIYSVFLHSGSVLLMINVQIKVISQFDPHGDVIKISFETSTFKLFIKPLDYYSLKRSSHFKSILSNLMMMSNFVIPVARMFSLCVIKKFLK